MICISVFYLLYFFFYFIFSDGTVSYDLFKEYYFLPDRNARNPEKDILKIPNIPLFSAGSSMKDAGYFTLMGFKASINAMIGNEGTSLFIEKSVKDIIWGYDDKLTAMGRSFMPAGALKSDQFGLLVGKNYSVDGRMRVHTGASDLTMVGQIKSFNEQETYNVWPDKKCDQMRGADGSFMEPMLNMNSRLEITVIDLCRTIKLVPNKYVQVGPMKTLQFLPDENLFNYDAEENKCYCPETVKQAEMDYEEEESEFEEDNSFDSWFDEEEESETPDNLDNSKKDKCTGNGVFHIGPCKFGAPLAVSWPHFLNAEPKIETVEGLNPDPKKHQMYMNVQPEMGIGFSAYIRMQFNLKMEKSQAFPILNTLPIGDEFLVPIMWFEDVIDKPPENLATLLKDAVDTGPNLGQTSVIILSMNLIVQFFVFVSYMLWSFHKDTE